MATTLNSKDQLDEMYSDAAANRRELLCTGASVVHGIDATNAQRCPLLRKTMAGRAPDVVVFNFPHAGWPIDYDSLLRGTVRGLFESNPFIITRHQKLVDAFFTSCARTKGLLHDESRVQAMHKNAHPYDAWDIPGSAARTGFKMASTYNVNHVHIYIFKLLPNRGLIVGVSSLTDTNRL